MEIYVSQRHWRFELDLLTKWLSSESLQHALRIRAVHVSNPEAGLERFLQRLDRNYGSPETIEASLFGRLETFHLETKSAIKTVTSCKSLQTSS